MKTTLIIIIMFMLIGCMSVSTYKAFIEQDAPTISQIRQHGDPGHGSPDSDDGPGKPGPGGHTDGDKPDWGNEQPGPDKPD